MRIFPAALSEGEIGANIVQLDPEGSYFMPVSIPQRPLKAGIFEDVWTLSTSYETDKDALAALLPVPFEPADEPVVTVHYSQCLKVNILAGGGYNLIGVDLATFFNGRQDQLAGNYSLVMWENLMNPVIRGRELLGVPKLFADVPDPSRSGDDWRVSASESDRVLLEMEILRARPRSEAAVNKLNADQANSAMMGWKYIPNIDGVGAALSQPTLIGRQTHFSRLWKGEGRIGYGNDLTWETNPASVDIVAALQTLVVKEYLAGSVTQGSMTITRALNRVLA